MNNPILPIDESINDDTFLIQAYKLGEKIEEVCEDCPHAGATVVALINTLCCQLHDMINSNLIDRKTAIDQVKEDIDSAMQELENMDKLESSVTLPCPTSNTLN